MKKQNDEKPKKKKPNLVGWSITDVTQRQLQKIAATFRVKKVKAIHKIFVILFSELAENEDFKHFTEMYDRLQEKELSSKGSIYASFDIDKVYMDRFKDTMFRFDFVDRSPFFRIVVDYVFQKYCQPALDNTEYVKKDLEEKGYKVKNIAPAMMGDIFIQIENPKPDSK
ncbi:MAG: hypothetical protein KAW12_06095 [Candidatus Aminicenantes bacterium]|nr:hypothetical protein [Candidatus Aminicenantes bacterium]